MARKTDKDKNTNKNTGNNRNKHKQTQTDTDVLWAVLLTVFPWRTACFFSEAFSEMADLLEAGLLGNGPDRVIGGLQKLCCT